MKIIRIIYYILINIIRSLSSIIMCIIPKKKGLWIFSSWFGQKMSDNSASFYYYSVSQAREDLQLVWVLKDRSLVEKLERGKINAVYAYSVKGVYYQIRAEICFFSHSIYSDFISAFISRTTKRCNFWHGLPLKKIGYDDNLNSWSMKYFQGNRYSKYLFNEFYTYTISSGRLYTEIFSKAFGINRKKIYEFGFPRCEVFMEPEQDPEFDNTIVYMPTFRESSFSEYDLIKEANIDLEKTSLMLKKIRCKLIIRLHPVNYSKCKYEKYENIEFDNSSNFEETLSKCKLLITDYSSIMFDFYLTKKTIIFFPFDLPNYLKKDRELYFDYSSVIPKENIINSWDEIFDFDLDIGVDKFKLAEDFHASEFNNKSPNKSLFNLISSGK